MSRNWKRRARAAARRLPKPVKRAIRRAQALARRAGRRLPEPVRRRIRGAQRRARRSARRFARSRTGIAVFDRLHIYTPAPPARELAELTGADAPVILGRDGEWFRTDVLPSHRYQLVIETSDELAADSRAGIIQYRVVGTRGELLDTADIGKPTSAERGYFDYIPRVPRGTSSVYVVLTPENARAIDIRLTTNRADDRVTVTSVALSELGPRTEFKPFDLPPDLAPRHNLRLAVIADTFTITALQLEASVVALTKDGWKQELDEFEPDLLIIESAWNGNDGQWLYCLAGLKPTDMRVRELVEYARSKQITVLFWNKEDPAHYDDFIEAAKLCDVVATTDAEMIPRYTADLGHDRVFALPFCVQTDIHNPRQPGNLANERIRAAGFLGSWWASKFDARRASQEALFEGSAPFGLEIFDRYLTYSDHERYRFAPEWLPYVHGSLSYQQALTAYRRYAVLLNVNTVTDSPTMFSRRALEASACGALVVTNPSAGTTEALGDLVVSAATAQECASALERLGEREDELNRTAHRAFRHTHLHHTWANRLADVATHCNITIPPRPRPKVSVVLATKRPEGADRILRYLATIDDPALELEPIVITAFDPAVLTAEAEIERLGAIIAQEGPDETLGDCLNRGAAMSSGGFIAKVDDDDIYGPRYFQDLLLALDYSRADIVGKQCHYQYFEVNDTTVLRYPGTEHRETKFVCGSTLLALAAVYEKIQFPQRRVGEDTEFLRRATEAGLRIYSADRFNYVSQRRADLSSHTWQAEHDELLQSKSSRVWGSGLPWDDINA